MPLIPVVCLAKSGYLMVSIEKKLVVTAVSKRLGHWDQRGCGGFALSQGFHPCTLSQPICQGYRELFGEASSAKKELPTLLRRSHNACHQQTHASGLIPIALNRFSNCAARCSAWLARSRSWATSCSAWSARSRSCSARRAIST